MRSPFPEPKMQANWIPMVVTWPVPLKAAWSTLARVSESPLALSQLNPGAVTVTSPVPPVP